MTEEETTKLVTGEPADGDESTTTASAAGAVVQNTHQPGGQDPAVSKTSTTSSGQ